MIATAIVFGLLMGPIALPAGLVVYGLAHDERSRTFGTHLLIWSLVGMVLMGFVVTAGMGLMSSFFYS